MSDEDTVDDFAGKISGLVSKSASLGTIIEEPKIVKKFLTGLPSSKYIHIVASLEQVLDLNTTGFEDIVGRLKTYEERVMQESKGEEQGKLMYASNNKPNRGGSGSNQEGRTGGGNEGNSGGQSRDGGGYRGRGKGDNRGRGRGRSNGQYREKETADDRNKKDLSKVQCWRCDKFGHYVNNCPSRPQRNQESNMVETQEADALYIHEVVFLNEDKLFPRQLGTNEDACVWYLDNGASNHMTGGRDYFTTLDENVRGKVRFGDGSQVDIEGKGSITFVSKTKERRQLKDIYYIPSLKHNIISLGQATEHGCEVNMKGSTLVLKDSQGRLLVQVTRSPNRLYKTPMEIYHPKCLQIQGEDITCSWHARLGHVSFGVMKNMADKEMVIGMPSNIQDKEVCRACLEGKQTRSVFPAQSGFRAKELLELVHGDLCGPISPSTPSSKRYIFVLIDEFSRYMWTMLLKEKSEAFDQFKRFKAYVENQTKKKIYTLRECVEEQQIEVEHVPGVEQKADILTKPLGKIEFKKSTFPRFMLELRGRMLDNSK